MAIDPEFARQRIAIYREEQKRAEHTLQLIDDGTMRFSEATGNEPLHDVTDKRRAEMVRQIAMYEDLVKLWSRDLA